MSTRCEADHKMVKVGTVSLDPKSVSWLDHDGAREAVATDWMRWDVWRCDECAETRVDSTDESPDEQGHDYKSIMARKTGVSVEQLDKETREADEDEQDPREVALWEAHHKKGLRTFGKKRWDAANMGWGTTEDSIASKVYGRKPKVLVSSYEGDEIVHRVEDYRR